MMPPPPLRAAMLAAAIRSRCPECPQCGQRKFRPAGLGTRREQAGHVEEVPRSSASKTVIPAASALSLRARIRWPTRQSRVRRLWRRPASSFRTPRGSPTASVPTRCSRRPAHHGLGGFVLGLADPPQVPGLGLPLAALRYCRHRRDPRCPGLGARRAAARVRPLRSRRCWRHSARTARPDTSSRCPPGPAAAYGWMMPRSTPATRARVGPGPFRVGGDGDLGGHVQVQAPGVEAEGHRPDLAGRVGQVPVQAHQQRRAAPGHREAQHPPVQGERARIPADRHQSPPAPREPRRAVPGPAPFGGGEPGVGVAAQHRPGAGAVELAESARPRRGQLPAQLLVGRQRGVLAAPPPPVQLQHGAPHVARRAQQPEQPVPLAAGHAQPAPRGAVHHRRRIPLTFSRHEAIKPPPTDKTRLQPGNQPQPSAGPQRARH